MAAFEDICTLQFQAVMVDNVEIRNTLHFRRNPSAGDVDATFLTALVADANTNTLVTKWAGMLPTDGVVTGVLARATQDPLNPSADRDEAFRGYALAGTHGVAGVRAPSELTCLMKLTGDLAGRRFRGKNWLPPPQQQADIVGENINGAGTWVTARGLYLTEINKTLYTSGAGHYGGSWNDFDMVVFSRRGRSLDETYYARVSAVSMPNRLHWLRSRSPQG